MNVNDLRIGNLIKPIPNEKEEIINTISYVEGVTNDGFIFTNGFRLGYYSDNEDFEPIQITEEWLIKFGFKKSAESEWYNLPYFQIEIVVDKNNDFTFCVANNFVIKHVKYIHELQNLYYSIKGIELQLIE